MIKDINSKGITAVGLAIVFLLNIAGPLPPAQAQELILPKPMEMLQLSSSFNPPILKGIKVHPDNPFRFDFILDQGDAYNHHSKPDDKQLKSESVKLIKYFLASLTIPEKDLWVNLSPYEKNRIIPSSFGQTEMGRDLLAEDYMLKQITASLVYPDDKIGKIFWKRIYEETAKKFGTTNIPVNTFNKVWIVPERAVVYENARAGAAYIIESKLKVMLEQDYLALEKNTAVRSEAKPQNGVNALGSQILRQIVIPELTKEVNENKDFSQLRQVYDSLILAAWYKRKIKESVLAEVYEDKNKTQGLSTKASKSNGPGEVEEIYQRYLQAFKKGSYNFIKEEEDPFTRQIVPRKYFSGGFDLNISQAMVASNNPGSIPVLSDSSMIIEASIQSSDPAMANPLTSFNQHEAEIAAEVFFAGLPRSNKLKQAVVQGEIPERNALAVLRHLFIEITISDQDKPLTGEKKLTPGDFLPITADMLFRPHFQGQLSKIALRRLKAGAKRPDIFSHENMVEIFKGKTVLVTGGSGYIAVAVIRALHLVGATVIVYSRSPNPHNLVTDPVDGVICIQGELVKKDLEDTMKKYNVNGVIHLAAETLLPKSNRQPAKFFDTNVLGTMELVDAMEAAGVHNVVYASSTMVYSGEEVDRKNRKGVFEEDIPTDPKSAYGATKHVVELYLKEKRKAGIRSVILRTFNVAGAFQWRGRWFGEKPGPGNHLIPRLVKWYLYPGRVSFSIMGNKYPTKDGTTVRDFIHPEDVADAYVRSLAHLFDQGHDLILNVGTRQGVSVLEIVKSFKSVVKDAVKKGMKIPEKNVQPAVANPRPGDPIVLMANTIRASLELGGWKPQKSIWAILKSSLDYHFQEGEIKSLALDQPPLHDDSLPEWEYMGKVYDKVADDSSISDKLKFEILFFLFIYTLNPQFTRGEAPSAVIMDAEIELYQMASKIQASPEGLINAINDEVETERRNKPDFSVTKTFRDALLEYRDLLLRQGDEFIYQQKLRYVQKLLDLFKSLPKTPNLKIMFDRTPSRDTENKILELLRHRQQFDATTLNYLRVISGLTRENLFIYLRHLARLERLKPDPVNFPEEWELLVPVYEGPHDPKSILTMRLGAATRDKYWYGMSNAFVFFQGRLYCRRNKEGDLDVTMATVDEVGVDNDQSRRGQLRDELNLPHVALTLFIQYPKTQPSIFDPANSRERLEDGIYYGEVLRPSRVEVSKVINNNYAVTLTQEQARIWKMPRQTIPYGFERVKPQELIDFYNKGVRLSSTLRAALSYPEFREWLIKQGDAAQVTEVSPKGGIDLQSTFKNLQVPQQEGSGIHFHIDPLKLQELRAVPGFVPVIIGILPLVNLRSFLGINGPLR